MKPFQWEIFSPEVKITKYKTHKENHDVFYNNKNWSLFVNVTLAILLNL